ncbi:MAG: ATP-binding protein [Pseudomonadota bacterium]
MQDPKTQRRNDFFVLGCGALAVMTLLLFTNAIGIVEWGTAMIVLTAGSLAYYVGSTAPEGPDTTTAQDEVEASTLTSHAQQVEPPELPERSRQLIGQLPFPAVLIDADGQLAVTNSAARDVFRLKVNDTGRAASLIRLPELVDAINRVKQTESHERVELSLSQDAENWMAYVQPGLEAGTVFLVLEDTTAVRRAERARADFLANASHELRTPLTAVGGFIETMRGPAREDKAAWDGFLEIMQQQTDRMKRLVADLLSLSRIEFSEHQTPSTLVNAKPLAARVHRALKPIAEESGVTFQLEARLDEYPIIADADEVTQVIQNLAGNALKYTPKGGHVWLSIGLSHRMVEAATTCARQMPDALRAVLIDPRASSEVPAFWLRVEDDGSGIPARDLPRLGERFYRADKSRGGDVEGTGLGLAIVKHIMARHRGGLAVESIEGRGTAFGVWMPCALIEEDRGHDLLA